MAGPGTGKRPFQIALQPRPLAGPNGDQLYVVVAKGKQPQRNGPVQRQALLAAIAEECDEAIIRTGPGGVIEIWNHAAEELFGWGEKEAVGCPDVDARASRTPARGGRAMARAWAGEVLARVETVRVCKHGSRVEVSVSFAPLRDRWGQVTGVSQVIRDITQQKASERALAYQAMHDHLTGLPNRSLLEDRMAHALERCRREGKSIGVMFFDLDHFKTVNDTAGHEVGDKLLRAVASRLRQSVRSMDTVARMGGDEFVVLCEDITDDAQLDIIVSHIMGSFSEPVVLPDRQLWVSVSAGVVSGGPIVVGGPAVEPGRRRHVPGQGTGPGQRGPLRPPHPARPRKAGRGLTPAAAGPRSPPVRALLPAHRRPCTPAPWWGPRPWCAGRTPCGGWSRPRTSCLWPRSWAWSARSVTWSWPTAAAR